MDDDNQNLRAKPKNGSNHNIHNIRIRPSMRGSNISPFKQQKAGQRVDHNNFVQQEVGDMLKKIPRVTEYKDGLLVEGHFSFVDQGVYKWKIGKTIGKGNSCVKKAMNVKNGKTSAVKQILFESEQEEKLRLNQIKILKRIDHPNIVKILEDYKVKNETWIFMEYIPRSLKLFYLEYGPPPTDIFLHFAKQILSALAQLEDKKIIHKDIKCQNILLGDDGVLKLCDFGCSKDFKSTFSLHLYQNSDDIKSFRGSYLWTAPECLIGRACFLSDIWSLGCSLVELASGKLPWSEKNFDNQFQAIKYIVEENDTPEINEQWDPRIKQLINCCLKRNPEQRTKATELLQKKHIWI